MTMPREISPGSDIWPRESSSERTYTWKKTVGWLEYEPFNCLMTENHVRISPALPHMVYGVEDFPEIYYVNYKKRTQ